MTRTISLVVVLLASMTAADVAGKWSGTFKVDGGDHDVPQLFILKQQGMTITGSGGPNAGEQYPIEDGHVEGNELRFTLTTGEWRFEYDLKQTEADVLKGEIKLKSADDSRSAKVSLTKVKIASK